VIVRQTFGWVDDRTGKRKVRDRISGSQFRIKTGLSKRNITKTIQSLVAKNLIEVTSFKWDVLHSPDERQGKTHLYYSLSPVHMPTFASAQKTPKPVQISDHNKTNYIKLKRTKLRQQDTGHIGKLLPNLQTLFTSNS
jgi:hypothetical protein